MEYILEKIDFMLLAIRDTEKHRNKSPRKTCIHTVMNYIEYKRRVYKTKVENALKKYYKKSADNIESMC